MKKEPPLLRQDALAETRSRLMAFLNDLPEEAFDREEVARRIRRDTCEHHGERGETLRIGWSQ